MSFRSGHRKGPQGGSVVVCSKSVSGSSGPNVRRAVFAVPRVGSRPGGGGAGVPASTTGVVPAAKPSGACRLRGIGNGCVNGRRRLATTTTAVHAATVHATTIWRCNSHRGLPGTLGRCGENHVVGRGAGAVAQVRGPATSILWPKKLSAYVHPAGLLCAVCGVPAFSLSEVLQRLVPTSVTAGAGPREEMAQAAARTAAAALAESAFPTRIVALMSYRIASLAAALFIVPGDEEPGEGAGGLECLLPPFPSFGRGGLGKTDPGVEGTRRLVRYGCRPWRG